MADTGTPEESIAAWHPDPGGRHELRWWDGTAWTPFVCDGGNAFAEPPTAADGPARRSRRHRRRPRTEDEWIELGWHVTWGGCLGIPVAFVVTIIVLFTALGEDYGTPDPTVEVIGQAIYAIGLVAAFLGFLSGCLTTVATLLRRGRRKAAEAVHPQRWSPPPRA